MAMNSFDPKNTRRLAIGLLSMSGALLFAELGLFGVGISVNKQAFVTAIYNSIIPLFGSAAISFCAFVFAEIAAHPQTPDKGHPHSKQNYLQSAFVFLAVIGLGLLFYAILKLISALQIAQ